MVFQIPENIAPECYPMAWLMGEWRGGGVLEYEGVDAAAYVHEISIDNDNAGPWLRFRSDVWLAQESAGAVDKEVPGVHTYRELTKGDVWSSLTGFIRVTPNESTRDGMTLLEATSSSPAGHAVTWAGLIKGPQFQFQADAIAATPTAPELSAGRIMGGMVNSDLMLAYDMAAFGHEMRTYMAGRLSRI
ncbi:FABP family protein [Arcanobacterium haemolyticum]|nr:FABP family protein [Arcanobacterium haemolyticum]